ncbi:hypothetical protein CDAR_212801 [Caerostris darwini]|uniref:Uncharacterized protein n=1 Tax=Caerostris darwini TaxID=1538125 RepID=A0AAV4SIK2_9ARAC|nr:hypothetical protein CDAR_212801 [Caerostris darwini]
MNRGHCLPKELLKVQKLGIRIAKARRLHFLSQSSSDLLIAAEERTPTDLQKLANSSFLPINMVGEDLVIIRQLRNTPENCSVAGFLLVDGIGVYRRVGGMHVLGKQLQFSKVFDGVA